MINKDCVRIGIVQSGAVYLDIQSSMEKAAFLLDEAIKKGAELVVFGETWLTGYPAWLDICPEVGLWAHEPSQQTYALMYKNSVTVPGKETDQFCEWAKKYHIVICIGINEVVLSGIGSGTIYNSLLIIDSNGVIVNHHRKLMPTFTEKLVYGIGDGYGLKSVETDLGRIGGLICWEHWMPLARQAMHNANEHIHIAVWPSVHELHQMASRHYAFEGRCFVVAVGQIMRAKEIPPQLKTPPQFVNKPDAFVLNGGSCIIGPNGKFIVEPIVDTEGVFVFEISDLDSIYKERMTLDTSGHYNRSDIFDFKVNRERKH